MVHKPLSNTYIPVYKDQLFMYLLQSTGWFDAMWIFIFQIFYKYRYF